MRRKKGGRREGGGREKGGRRKEEEAQKERKKERGLEKGRGESERTVPLPLYCQGINLIKEDNGRGSTSCPPKHLPHSPLRVSYPLAEQLGTLGETICELTGNSITLSGVIR